MAVTAERPGAAVLSVWFLDGRRNRGAIRGAAIGVSARLRGERWGREVWRTTDRSGAALFSLPGFAYYRIASHVGGRRREVVHPVLRRLDEINLVVVAGGGLVVEALSG